MIPNFPVAGLMLAASNVAALLLDIIGTYPSYYFKFRNCGHISISLAKPDYK